MIDVLDRDALGVVLSFVHPNYAFVASLACKALRVLLRLLPGQQYKTDVLSMNYSSTMLKWATCLPVHCPPLKCVANLLGNSDHRTRVRALETLGNLDPMVIAVHAVTVITVILQFGEPQFGAFGHHAVRYAAVQTLSVLDPATLAPHVDAIMKMLDHAEPGVRLAAVFMMGKLDPLVLAQHSGAVALKLCDSCGDVRYTAMETLCVLVPSALSSHASDIVGLRRHIDPEVRRVAMYAMRKLRQAVCTSTPVSCELTPCRMGLGFLLNDLEKTVYGAISTGCTFAWRIQAMECEFEVEYPLNLTPVSLIERLQNVRKKL